MLQKAYKGETWKSVFVGHGEVDPVTQQEMQKKILLERFQEEVKIKNNLRTPVLIFLGPQ